MSRNLTAFNVVKIMLKQFSTILQVNMIFSNCNIFNHYARELIDQHYPCGSSAKWINKHSDVMHGFFKKQ